jgi:Ca2+-binding RTX toxin-like protein
MLLLATMAVPVGAEEGFAADTPNPLRQALDAIGMDEAPEHTDLDDRSEHVPLASGLLRRAVDAWSRGEVPTAGVDVVDDSVLVEILVDGEMSEVVSLVISLGGVVTGHAGEHLIEAEMPVGHLVALEADRRVAMVRPPLIASHPIGSPVASASAAPDVVGEELGKINADAWHAAGITGDGVSVGIIDTFGGGYWSDAQAAGEVPAPAGTFCRREGGSCDPWIGGDHGVSVAEVLHEMAPGADIYLAAGASALATYSRSDVQAAVDYFAGNGVSIISHSATAEFDGPGDGTGPLADVVDDAVANGMNWFNSAGNNSGDEDHLGSYWRGAWKDDNQDGWLEFGDYIALVFYSCGLVNGVRWSDWGEAGATDYDVYIFDTADDLFLPERAEAIGSDRQSGGAPPLEHVESQLPLCITEEDKEDIDYLQIKLVDEGAAAQGDILEFMVNSPGLLPSTNPYSAAGPYSDTASPGGLSVGAIDPPGGVQAGYYSAWGPTNDERIKPDLVAAAGMFTFTEQNNPDGDGRFHGTSAATPAAAGAAALVLDSGLASSPAQVRSYLLSEAVVDRGPGGADNTYGYGELILPSPPEPVPTLEITSPAAGSTVSGTVTISAQSTGTVTGVEFLVDGASLGTDWNPADGWSHSWDTTSYADGGHTVSAVARNDGRANDSVDVTVDNFVPPVPTLTITSPAAGSTVSGTVLIQATSTGTVTGVEFLVDGASLGTDWNPADGWSRSWDTTQSTNGGHTISVVARNDGRANDSVDVTVDNFVPRVPTLTITSPAAGSRISGTVTVTAQSTGTVTGVEFLVDGASLGTDWNPADGWSRSWDTTQVADGGHTISVVARNDGRANDSISVTVDNREPTAMCKGFVATIVGTPGADFLDGTPGPDVIHGLGGVDSIDGLAGDDVICGGEGDDFLYGGAGADLLSGDAGADNLDGDDGDDTLLGGSGNDYLSGGDGDDLLRGQLGDDWSWGEAGDDRIQDGPGDDGLEGGDGKDKLWGGIGEDLMWGGPGRDQLHGGRDDDSLYGGADTDRMWADSGDDYLWGGPNSDFLYGGIGNDSLSGEAGNDRLFGWTGEDNLWGGPGRDQLRGQAGDDLVDGGMHYDWCSVEPIWTNCEQPL